MKSSKKHPIVLQIKDFHSRTRDPPSRLPRVFLKRDRYQTQYQQLYGHFSPSESDGEIEGQEYGWIGDVGFEVGVEIIVL